MVLFFNQDKWVLAIIFVIASFLLLSRLDNAYLWQDEAETAIIAKNILTQGYPSANDGKNIVTQNFGKDSNEHYVWTWSPWVQHYVAATSFAILGTSTLSARLPFALIGLASIVLFYFFCLKYTKNKQVALLSTILFVTSIPFLLHARQCRWYMPVVFSVLWLLIGYKKILDHENWGGFHFGFSSTLLFHSNFVIFFLMMPGLGVHFLLHMFSRKDVKALKNIIIAFAFSLLFTVPWFIYTKSWDKSNALEEYTMPIWEKVIFFLSNNLIGINSYFLPLIFLIPLASILIIERRAEKKLFTDPILLGLLIIGSTLAVYLALPWIYIRYLLALIPVCALLLGIVTFKVYEWNKLMGYGLLGILMFTNVFSLPFPPHVVRFDLASFLYEITHDYDCPNEGIVKFLKENGNESQLVVTNYGQLPIIFYTNMRIIGFGQDIKITQKPDWVIIRKDRGNERYLRYLCYNYRNFTIDYPDILWGNRPDPFYHKYRTEKNAPKVVISRKL